MRCMCPRRQALFALPVLFLALLTALLTPLPGLSAPLPSCLGETRSLVISSGMPYTPLRVQGRTGFFVLDLGADGSAISPGTFLGRRGPLPLQGSGLGGTARHREAAEFRHHGRYDIGSH